MKAIWTIIVLSIAFGAYRVFVEPTSLQLGDTYKDLAHLFVGGLFGAWLFGRRAITPREIIIAEVCLTSAVVLTVIEVVCAIAGSLT